jgi:hypothetical protein
MEIDHEHSRENIEIFSRGGLHLGTSPLAVIFSFYDVGSFGAGGEQFM